MCSSQGGEKIMTQIFLLIQISFLRATLKTTVAKQTGKKKQPKPKEQKYRTCMAEPLSNRIWAYSPKVFTMPLCQLSSVSRQAFDSISNKHMDYTVRRDLHSLFEIEVTPQNRIEFCAKGKIRSKLQRFKSNASELFSPH